MKKFIIDVAFIIADDYEKFFNKLKKKPPSLKQLRKQVFLIYHKWLKIWNPIKANKLFSNRFIDHKIHLKEEIIPFVKRAYDMFKNQAFVVKEYIDEMLKKGYIKLNSLSYATFILIVKKSNEGFRICVDYWVLNALIISNHNASSLIKKTLAKLCAAKIYNKFDIIIVFNEIKVKKNHKEKTAFLIKYDLYEYMIMPFELCNASVTF